jgi:hypothetical protein
LATNKHTLKDVRKYAVEKTASGIYTVNGDILPMQVIESPKLSADDNLWLKTLRRRLDYTAANQISEEAVRRGKEAKIKAYLDAVMRANKNIFKEVEKMRDPSIVEVFKDLGIFGEAETKLEAKIEKETKEKDRQYFLELLRQGLSYKEIEQRLAEL